MSANAIDGYVGELGRALRGPARAKASLLTEARGSLADAAEAFQGSGLDRETAERRAVEEFGKVKEIAPDYQAELGLAQGRRTALLLLCFTISQPTVVWGYAWRAAARAWGADPTAPGHLPPGYVLVSEFVNWFGGAALAGALLVMLACGIGVRYLAVQRLVPRAFGIFALTACAVFAVTGLLLTVLSPGEGALLNVTELPWTMVFLMLPLAGIGVSARRCLAAAR